MISLMENMPHLNASRFIQQEPADTPQFILLRMRETPGETITTRRTKILNANHKAEISVL